ncbi:thiamine diphosphokinase [Bacillus sp. T33-2]|uniref:thiamine diphosphokinase n=1 Tax=Bacillus sp. T33-2 TaxID=2054168 RepID=UPI000C7864B4|nr:thiamine diphosphokinase [Bacillus sp. T33-2]PLR97731.1 thiamine diphosphokinase [Bacillus sp. T33-2]
MNIHIMAGGPPEFVPDLRAYKQENTIWVGVDKGVLALLDAGIEPQYAFGDFDSVTDEEWLKIERQVTNLIRFKPEKDETDMELAINWALEQDAGTIRLFGATGGRLDHLLANIQLLLKPLLQNLDAEIEMIDNNNHIYVKGPGVHSIAKMPSRKYISFVAVTPSVSALTLKGFKYPLNGCNIPLGSTLCISNELISDYGTFSFEEGILLVVRSSD